MNTFHRKVLLPGIVVLGLLLIGLGTRNFLTQFGWSKIDYSKRAPGNVFQFATGSLPSNGVTNLKASGRVYLGRHWIWLRFHVTDSAIKKLTVQRERYIGKAAFRQIHESVKISANKKYDALDLNRVSWHQVTKIAQPEVYDVGHIPNSAFVLMTYLILDRQNHVAYIYAFGD